jgi:hypothetical protein
MGEGSFPLEVLNGGRGRQLVIPNFTSLDQALAQTS